MSLVHDTTSRQVIASAVEGGDLERAVATAQAAIDNGTTPRPAWKTPAILIQRSDRTLEAQREHWEEEFYDRDVRGYRIRRFRAPQIERDWIKMVKEDRKKEKAEAKMQNDMYSQRR